MWRIRLPITLSPPISVIVMVSRKQIFSIAHLLIQPIESPMMLVDSVENSWTSLIPAYPSGTEVQYYISADANDGKHQVRPIVAPEGYFKFEVLGEPANQPPSV